MTNLPVQPLQMNLDAERDRLLALAEVDCINTDDISALCDNFRDMAALIRAQAAEIERLRADLAETKHWESVIAAERDELSRALRGLLDDDAPLRNAGTPELIAFWQSEKEQGRGNAHLYLAAYAALGAIAAEREGES